MPSIKDIKKIKLNDEYIFFGPESIVSEIADSMDIKNIGAVPTLKKPIALARFPRKNKKTCFAEARGKLIQAKIGSPKFVIEGKAVFKERK